MGAKEHGGSEFVEHDNPLAFENEECDSDAENSVDDDDIANSLTMRWTGIIARRVGAAPTSGRLATAYIYSAILFMLTYQGGVLVYEAVYARPHAQTHPGEQLPSLSWTYDSSARRSLIRSVAAMDDMVQHVRGEEIVSGSPVSYGTEKITVEKGVVTAVHFAHLGIRGAANVSSANFKLEMYGQRAFGYLEPASQADLVVRVQAEKSEDSLPLRFAKYDISARELTSASVEWSFPAQNGHQVLTSPDLSHLFTELQSDDKWGVTSSLTLVLTPTSRSEGGRQFTSLTSTIQVIADRSIWVMLNGLLPYAMLRFLRTHSLFQLTALKPKLVAVSMGWTTFVVFWWTAMISISVLYFIREILSATIAWQHGDVVTAVFNVLWAVSYPAMFIIGSMLWLISFMISCDQAAATIVRAAQQLAEDEFDRVRCHDTIENISLVAGDLNNGWQTAQMMMGATLAYVLYISLIKVVIQGSTYMFDYIRTFGCSVGLMVILLAPARVTAATEEVTAVLLRMQSTHKNDARSSSDIDLLVNYARSLDMGYKVLDHFTISYGSVKNLIAYACTITLTIAKAGQGSGREASQ
jgi:hypothetical protein